MLETFRRTLRRLRAQDLSRRARWGLVHAESRAWEAYFDVDTSSRAGGSPRQGDADGRPYEPLSWMVLRRALAALGPGPDDVLLDYGAGLGRVVLFAARRGLKRVIGLELEPELATRARANVASAQRRLRSPVEIVVADAARYDVPDDVTVAFLFNPFIGRVMRAAQQRLVESLERRPRPLRILYTFPHDQPDLFAGCGWARAVERVDAGVYDGLHVLIYEHASGQAPAQQPGGASA